MTQVSFQPLKEPRVHSVVSAVSLSLRQSEATGKMVGFSVLHPTLLDLIKPHFHGWIDREEGSVHHKVEWMEHANIMKISNTLGGCVLVTHQAHIA